MWLWMANHLIIYINYEKKTMDKAILITGVAGLIGSRMADWLIENHKEYKIIGIDDLSGGYIENVHPNVVFYKKNLSTDDISELFKIYNIDYVYHFACYAAEGLSPFMRKFNWANNAVSTANIINECINNSVKRLVYTSSMSVYGWGENPGVMFDESDQPMPIDPYAISKYACELDIKNAGEQHGLDWCIIRPHNVYGIKQNIWDKYRNVLGIWMYQALNDKPMLIYGSGEQTRSFSYIDDCLEPLWNAAVLPQASKEIINLGGTTGISIKDACYLESNVIGYDKIEYREARHEVKHAVPTHQKSIDILYYKETTSLEDGIRNMWEWAKTQPNRPQQKWDKYEIEKGIYSYWK